MAGFLPPREHLSLWLSFADEFVENVINRQKNNRKCLDIGNILRNFTPLSLFYSLGYKNNQRV